MAVHITDSDFLDDLKKNEEEKKAKEAENQAKKEERDRKRVECEKKKAEREKKKAEREKKKADRERDRDQKQRSGGAAKDKKGKDQGLQAEMQRLFLDSVEMNVHLHSQVQNRAQRVMQAVA